MEQKKNYFKCKVRVQILRRKTVIISRKLPGAKKVLVQLNDEVSPEKIILEGESLAGLRAVELARVLNVDKKKVPNFLRKGVGDKVSEGEVLAEKTKVFGLIPVKVLSPIDGIIRGYDTDTGILTIEHSPRYERVTAGVWGQVVSIANGKVDIKTKITQIFGVAGSGKERGGILRVASKADEFLLPEAVAHGCKGAVLAGGAIITGDAFRKSMLLEASGIIVGGINVRDFWAAGGGRFGSFNFSSDVGITLVVIEGFGHLPISTSVYETLVENNGRFALVNGNLARIIIPHLEKPARNLDKIQIPDYKELEVGSKVRITSGLNIITSGEVVEIGVGKEKLASGLVSNWAAVNTNSGVVKVPIENLEILVNE